MDENNKELISTVFTGNTSEETQEQKSEGVEEVEMTSNQPPITK